jgi:hypothetical protein
MDRVAYFRGYYPNDPVPPNVAERNTQILKAIGVMI